MTGDNNEEDKSKVIEMNRDPKTGKFLPGKSGNPAGPGFNKYVRYLKYLDSKRYEQINRLVSSMSFKQLKDGLAGADHPENPYDVFELAIMSVWARIIERGDTIRLEAILNRMIGVPLKKYVVTKDQEDVVKNFLSMPREDRQKEIERLDKLAQEVGDE